MVLLFILCQISHDSIVRIYDVENVIINNPVIIGDNYINLRKFGKWAMVYVL